MRLRFALGTLLALTAAACGQKDVDIATLASNSDQVIFEAGQKALDQKQWDIARQHFRRVIDGFPQSQRVPTARLALADAFFREGGVGSYIQAAAQYREFITVFPSHPRGDYAQFQVGESYFKQKNSPDRDQTPTTQALEEYQLMLERYPDSPLTKEARERIKECRNSLARSEFLVGWFYQKTRRSYRASIARYEKVLKDFPDYSGTDETLLRLAQVLALSGRATEASPHIARLLEEFPQSPFAAMGEAMLAPPGATPSPAPEKK